MFDIIKSIKFRKVRNKFQEELKEDLSKIRKSRNMFVFADKTNNVYEMKSEDHEKPILENITKTYQKAPKKLEKSINLEPKSITKSLKLADRIDHLAKTEAFITLKDHKENFVNKPTCQLINSTKTELGKISKKMIEDINKQLIEKLEVNLWKSTKNVTD